MKRLLALGGLCAALAGCGDDGGDEGGEGSAALTQTQYQQKLEAALAPFQEQGTQASEALGGGDVSEAADEMAAFADSVRTAAADLEPLQPPDEVGALHDDLVSGLRAYAGDLEEASARLEDGEIGDLQEFSQFFVGLESSQELARISDGLDERGYNLPGGEGGSDTETENGATETEEPR